MAGKGNTFFKHLKRDWRLHVFMALPLLYMFLFDYYPMLGLQIAFKDFTPALGIWGSKWVGFKHFLTFFESYQFIRVLSNTIIISVYSILAGFPIPIFFALLLNTVKNSRFKKLMQTVTYFPHFISITVLVGMMVRFFSPINGFYGFISRLFGDGYPEAIYGQADTFLHFFVWSGIWQNLGWDSIIYFAALSSVSTDLYEAAEIDGATRWKRLLCIDLPTILPIAGIMLILRLGSILSVGWEKILLMQNNLNLAVSEVISTYVYKVGLVTANNFSYATAIGMFNSVINCLVLLLVNYAARKLSDNEVGLL